MHEQLESTSLADRVVVATLVSLSATGRTPANTAEIREASAEYLDGDRTETVGRLSEADVIRALNGLAETDLVVETRPDDSSPVGKGRPEYDLGVDAGVVRESLADDERVAAMLE
jgi:hypothetical protein